MKAENLDLFADLIGRAFTHAMLGFAQITGKKMEIKSFSVRTTQPLEVSQLLGGPDQVAVGVYLVTEGSAGGYVLLVFDPRVARAFVEMLTGDAGDGGKQSDEEIERQLIDMANGQGSEALGDFQRSALEEMGNITGSLLLTGLADVSDMALVPTPPRVVVDLVGALVDVLATDPQLSDDAVLVADAAFSTSSGEATGTLLFVPSNELVGALEGGGS